MLATWAGADRPEALDRGSLQEVAQTTLENERQSSAPRFRRVRLEMEREDVHSSEAYRLTVASEERDNPHFPDDVLLFMENVQYMWLHPAQPDTAILVVASVRHPMGREHVSARALADAMVQTMMFE